MSETPAVVQVHRDGDIAWVTIDNPPVNATSAAVRAGLVRAVAEVRGARIAVLRCAGRTFIAGGDMTEFDAPPVLPHLPDVVQMIEDSPVPFVAVLHGTVLGGGFEVAMACAWRIAVLGTRFGLPEVNVGLIPGAGGTQRLPRLVGMKAAIDIACTGAMFTADQMQELGAVDIVTDDPEHAVIDLAKNLPARPTPVSQRAVASFADNLVSDSRAVLMKRAKGQQSPLDNLEALQWALEPFADGQAKERQRHMQMRQSAESRALRHAFFSERAAARPDAIRSVQPRDVHRIAVVGGGLMGAGIATAALMAGLQVDLIEQSDEGATAAQDRVQGLIDGAVKRGKASADKAAAMLGRFASHTGYAAAAQADLAVEAVFEDLAVKQQVFAELAAVMTNDAILATNTSYLDPRDIFAGIPHRARCIGLHFFSPAHIMKLLEVIRLPETSTEVLATGFAFGKRLRKVPVLAGICNGFIGNRILSAYRRAADYMLADGALPHQIDAAMRAFGMAMGPYEVQDMAGLQIAWANRQRAAATRPPAERYIPIADQLCEAGRLGRRAGKGWYDYDETGNATRSPQVDTLIEAYSAAQDISRTTYSDDEIVGRLLAVMANEGALIVEEGIAETRDVVDVVQLLGYGFPRWRGGPMHYAQETGQARTAAAMKQVADQSPGSWTIAEAYRT